MNEEGKSIDKWMALIIIAVILACSYLYVENQKLNYQKNKEIQKQETISENKEARDECLATADDDYDAFWESECKRIYHKKDCALPSYNANRCEKLRRESRNECIKMYPTN